MVDLVDLPKDEADKEIVRQVVKLLDLFEKRLDAQERVMARIVGSYPEIWATIQALIQTIGTNLEEDEQKEFITLVEKFRNEALEQMTAYANDLEQQGSGTEPDNTEPPQES